MKSNAKTVSSYLASLPPDRRKAISAVQSVVKKHLPTGYAETMQYGMISYVIPLSRYPAGYLNRKDEPIPYVSLGSQKNHMAIYLMNVYGHPTTERRFREAWKKTGKKLDMGKSCVRFKKLEDVALDAIGLAVAATSVEQYIEVCEKAWKKRA